MSDLERTFPKQNDRDEKGTAMTTVRADRQAMRAKSDRLRAQRLQQVADAPAEPVKAKKAVRKRAS